MSIITIILWVFLAVLLAAFIALFFLNKKYSKAKEQQDLLISKNSEWITLLVIEKKRCKASADTGYLPLFSTQERAVEFFEKTGRAGYLLIHSEFCEVLKTNREVNEGKTPVKIGAIVDPGYYGITVDVKNLDAVIDMAR